jgi:hypothetical protein
VEKRIYGGTCENKLVLRHCGTSFCSITDVAGITANEGEKELNVNENKYVTTFSINFTTADIITCLMSIVTERN